MYVGCKTNVGIEFFLSKNSLHYASGGKKFVLFPTMVQEKGVKKSQKWDLESVGAGRFGVGFKVVKDS